MTYRKFLYYTLMVFVFLILLIAGKHLVMVILTALGLWFGRKINQEEERVADEIKTNSRRQAELRSKAEELTNRFEWLQESSKRRRRGNHKIIFLLILSAVFGAGRTGITLAAGDLYIPESYEELRELYIMADREVRERDKLITEYQALVVDYEKSLQELTGLVNRLQKINREKDLLIAVKEETMRARARCIHKTRLGNKLRIGGWRENRLYFGHFSPAGLVGMVYELFILRSAGLWAECVLIEPY